MSLRSSLRLFVTGLAIIALALAAFALVRAGVFYSLYTWLFGAVTEETGLDLWAARAVALALLAALWLLPWHLALLPWTGGARTRAGLLAASAVALLFSMEVITRDVYFSRADGHPLKHYVLTLDGYKLSDAPGIDPVYGIPYRPITAQIARDYILWKRRGGNMKSPDVPDGVYFASSTGEPLRWCAHLPDGGIDMFTLPGFHPKTGAKLAPPTPEIIAQYEKQRAEAERQRQEEERLRRKKEQAEAEERARKEAIGKAREEEERRKEEELRLAEALAPGRYLFPRPLPQGRLDNLVFTLTEIDLAAGRMVMHLRVQNVGYDHWASPPSRVKRQIRFGITLPNGNAHSYTAVRATEGAVADDGAGFLCFPSEGQRGAFVMEFPALDPAIPTFSLLVNDEPLFSGISLRMLRHQPF